MVIVSKKKPTGQSQRCTLQEVHRFIIIHSQTHALFDTLPFWTRHGPRWLFIIVAVVQLALAAIQNVLKGMACRNFAFCRLSIVCNERKDMADAQEKKPTSSSSSSSSSRAFFLFALSFRFLMFTNTFAA